ncbi:MAG: hypothetical protein J6R85_00825, partial [Lentisphaeria bacterium]|nr:hypothetical protein [Lentisphaeria bacterium]
MTAASSAEKLRAAKQLLKHDALTCAWRDDRGIINATFQERNSFAHTQVRPGDPGESRCTSCHDEPGKLCEHAVAALMYCGRFNQEIKAIEDGVSNYAGLKYESLETLSARENPAPTARVRLEASSDFPHVPSKWENAVLTVRLQNADREYLGNVNNLRQLFFEKTLSIALKLSDFSLQDQQIIRFLAINGEPDHSNVLLNSEQTAEFFHCLVGFDRFFRGGKRLFIRGERAEAVILRRSENGKTFLSPGIRVENAMLPIQNAKVITGRAGCWIGKQGEYFFIPASLDVAWLRNFFRTGEHEMSSKISANLLLNGQFPVPVLEVRDFELKKWNCQILLGGFFDAENQFHLRVCYLYDHAVFQVGSGRIARVGRDFIQRDECGELKFENELAMFGFRQNGKVFTLDQAEGSGIFLDKMLPQILSTRNNICLEAPLARLCRGGNGLPSAELHCSFRERRKDGFLLEYTCAGAGSDLTLQELTAAARSGQSYIPSGSGALVRITPEMRTFLKGASNILLDHHPELHTFVVPYHSVPYFRHLTEPLPGAQVRELYLPEYLDFTPPPAEPEFTFAGELRTYQQEGVDWLKTLTDANFNVILADEMG